MRAVRQFLQNYRLPLFVVAVATVNSFFFWSLGPRVPLGLFMAAVLVSAWQGGVRSAVVATLLSTLILAGIGHYQTPGPEEDLVLRLGLFVLVGLIAGYLAQQCHQAIRAVDHVHDVLGSSGIALISADTQGRVTALNPLARTLTGLGEAEAHGRPLDQVFQVVHGSTRQPLALPEATAQDLPEGSLLVGPHGGETAVEGTIRPVRDTAGLASGLMIVFREAGGRTRAWQELHQRADRFRAIANSTPAALLVLDPEGRCVSSNPAAQSACTCTADECLGEGWSRHVQPQDRDRLISDWLQAVVSQAPFAQEFRVVGEQRRVRWLRMRSAPMLADDGAVLGHVAALDEVTDHRETIDALVDARREVEEHFHQWTAAEAKGEEAVRNVRVEAESRLQELVAARTAAEEMGRTLQRQLDERGTALRRAEETLASARAETEEKLRNEISRRQKLEAALALARQEAEQHAAAHQETAQTLAQTRTQFESEAAQALARQYDAEAELRRLNEEMQRLTTAGRANPAEIEAATQTLRDAWREEIEAQNAMHLDARSRLTDELIEHRAALQTTRAAHDQLLSLLSEKDKNDEARRQELEQRERDLAEARAVHERLQGALAEKDAHVASLQQEVEKHQAERGDHQRTAAELRQALEFVEGVIDSSPTGIFAHDGDGRCRVWNAALERLLGRPRAEALGRTAGELFPALDPSARHDSQDPGAFSNGAARAHPAPASVIGQSAMLETEHAPVLDRSGKTIGGMTLVRVLPLAVPPDHSALMARARGPTRYKRPTSTAGTAGRSGLVGVQLARCQAQVLGRHALPWATRLRKLPGLGQSPGSLRSRVAQGRACRPTGAATRLRKLPGLGQSPGSLRSRFAQRGA